jgi:hypothetical protein
MGSHSGPVWIKNTDGEEVEVAASLQSCDDQSSGLQSWDGSMVGTADWFGMMDTVTTIRIGERTGECLVTKFNPANPLGTVTIKGTGPAPFD